MSWASKLSNPYRIEQGKNFRLPDFHPATTGHFRSKEHVLFRNRNKQNSELPA